MPTSQPKLLLMSICAALSTPSHALSVSELAVNGVGYTEGVGSGSSGQPVATTLISAPYQNGYYWVTVSGRVTGNQTDLNSKQANGLVNVKALYGSFEYNRRLAGMLENGIVPLMLSLGSADCSLPAVSIGNWYDAAQVSAALQAEAPNRCFPLFSLGDKYAKTGYFDDYWYRGISVRLQPDSAGRFAYSVPVPADIAAQPFSISLQAPSGGAVLGTGTDKADPGMTTAITFSPLKTLALKGLANAVAAPSYSVATSGTPYAYNVTGSIGVGGNDIGLSGETYAAIFMGNRLFFHNGTDWVAYLSGAYPVYASGTLGSTQTLTLFTGYDLSRLSIPSDVYIGYGLSAADMLARGTYQKVTTLMPAPAKPEIVTISPTTVLLKTTTDKPTVAFTFTGVNLEALGPLTYQLDSCSSPAGNVVAAGNTGFTCTFDGSTGSKTGKVYQALTNKPDNPFSTTVTDVTEPVFSFTVTVNPPAGTGTGTGTSTPAAVSAVTPLTAAANVATTFTINGTNLKSASALLATIEGCTQTVTVTSDTQGTFVCTLTAGTRVGSVSAQQSGTTAKLFDFSVTVQSALPSVSSVSPLLTATNQITTYTINGQNLKSFGGSLRFNVTDCTSNFVNIVSDTTATVSCAHTTGGLKSGTVDALVQGGTIPLRFVEISVISP